MCSRQFSQLLEFVSTYFKLKGPFLSLSTGFQVLNVNCLEVFRDLDMCPAAIPVQRSNFAQNVRQFRNRVFGAFSLDPTSVDVLRGRRKLMPSVKVWRKRRHRDSSKIIKFPAVEPRPSCPLLPKPQRIKKASWLSPDDSDWFAPPKVVKAIDVRRRISIAAMKEITMRHSMVMAGGGIQLNSEDSKIWEACICHAVDDLMLAVNRISLYTSGPNMKPYGKHKHNIATGNPHLQNASKPERLVPRFIQVRPAAGTFLNNRTPEGTPPGQMTTLDRIRNIGKPIVSAATATGSTVLRGISIVANFVTPKAGRPMGRMIHEEIARQVRKEEQQRGKEAKKLEKKQAKWMKEKEKQRKTEEQKLEHVAVGNEGKDATRGIWMESSRKFMGKRWFLGQFGTLKRTTL